MIRNLPAILLLILFFGCKGTDHKSYRVEVEHYRSSGMKDNEVIQAAIDAAGPGGTVSFKSNREYLIENRILVKRFQRLEGNNSTLVRADQTYSRLTDSTPAKSRKLSLEYVPDGWRKGDQLQIFVDSTAGLSNDFGDYQITPNEIVSIDENIVTISTEVGPSINHTYTIWPPGTYVRKVFTMLKGDSIAFGSTPFTVTNMNFNGNRSNNELSLYWNVNSTIYMRGMGGKIEDCRFNYIPNETIVGQGMMVINCQARNLNGSFVHLAGEDTVHDYPQRNAVIMGNTVDGVCQISTYVTGHSEGFITLSYNGGFATVANNRVYNCSESAIGTIDGHYAQDDAGKCDFIITGNIFKNCKSIVHNIVFSSPGSRMPSDVFLSNNVFSNCGINDWTKAAEGGRHSGITVGYNSYSLGTTWTMPADQQ